MDHLPILVVDEQIHTLHTLSYGRWLEWVHARIYRSCCFPNRLDLFSWYLLLLHMHQRLWATALMSTFGPPIGGELTVSVATIWSYMNGYPGDLGLCCRTT